jgi:hypothetical protein
MVVIQGNYSNNPDAVASFAVKNNPGVGPLSYDDEKEAAEQLATFLLQVVPAGVLALAYEQIESKIENLGELGDIFDDLSFDVMLNRVDPGVNAFIVDKHKLWNGGAASTQFLLDFIRQAIDYTSTGHAEIDAA